jgi:ribose transport system substrate-binding protein
MVDDPSEEVRAVTQRDDIPGMRARLTRGVVAGVIVVLSLGLFATSVAGGANTTGAQKRVRLALFTLAVANSYSASHISAAKNIAKQMGADIKIFDGKFDASTQFKEIQDATASGQYDAFLIAPNNGPALVPAVKQAIAKGIKVGALFAPLGPDVNKLQPQVPGLTTTVMAPLGELGFNTGQLAAKACGSTNPCKVVYLWSIPTGVFSKAQKDGAAKAFARHPNIKVTYVPVDNFLAESGLKSMQNYLQRSKDFQVVTGNADQGVEGAELALKKAGLIKNVKLVGSGGAVLAVKAVREGRWYGTVPFLAKTEAAIGSQLMIKAARGQKVPLYVNVVTKGPKYITKANAKSFAGQWYG